MPEPTINKTLITSLEMFCAMQVAMQQTTSTVWFDTETTSADRDVPDIVSAQFGFTHSDGEFHAYFVPVWHTSITHYVFDAAARRLEACFGEHDGPIPREDAEEALCDLLEWLLGDPDRTIGGHNLKYDIRRAHDLILRRRGYPVTVKCSVKDTMMYTYFLETENNRLKDNCKEFLRLSDSEVLDFEDICPNFDLAPLVPIDVIAHYGYPDVYRPPMLLSKVKRHMTPKMIKLAEEVESPNVKVIAHMESIGVRMDVPLLHELDAEFAISQADLQRQIYDLVGCEFNLTGPQLSRTMYDDTRMWDGEALQKAIKKYVKDFGRGANGLFPANKEVIGDLLYYKTATPEGLQVAELISKYNSYGTVRGGFTGKLPGFVREDGRIHPSFSQVGTVTTRLSCADPNLMNIPFRDVEFRRLRECFIATPGWVLVGADFSALELVLMAHQSQDPILMAIFLSDPPGDPHQITADALGIVRSLAKCVSPTTWLTTPDGAKRISEFVGDAFDVSEPLISDDVLGTDGFVKVNASYRNKNDRRFLVVTNKSILVCSANHQFAAPDGTLVRAEDLAKGMPLAEVATHTAVKTHSGRVLVTNKDIPSTWLETTPQWAYFAGLFIGDGTANATSCSICVGNYKKKDNYGFSYDAWGEIVKGVMDDLGFRAVSYRKASEAAGTVYFGSSRTVSLLRDLGIFDDGTHHKKLTVPSWVVNGGEEYILSFLAGLTDSDGWITKQGTASITTKSPELAADVCFIANSIGLQPSPYVDHNNLYNRDYFRIVFKRSATNRIAQYMLHLGKRTRLTDKVRIEQNVQHKVRLVQPLDIGELVDLNLASEDHLYYTNSCLTHNTFNYAKAYGSGASNIARKLRIPRAQAQEYIDVYDQTYLEVTKFNKWVISQVREKGYIENIFGMRRYFNKAIKEGQYWNNAATNFPIQSFAAIVMKIAMRNIYNRLVREGHLNVRARMLLQIHDELLLEATEDFAEELAEIVSYEMCNAVQLRVPLRAESGTGPNWRECH